MTVATPDIRLAHQAALAAWSAPLRAELWPRLAVETRRSVLTIGDGESARELIPELLSIAPPVQVRRAPLGRPILARGFNPGPLPFADGAFDLVVCCGALMWADDPVALLAEMRRVAAPGGLIAALAEPDWPAFEEQPRFGAPATAAEAEKSPAAAPSRLGDLIAAALATHGADPAAGRRLAEWFRRAGLAAETGVAAMTLANDSASLDAAWEHHRRLLGGFVNERKLRVIERQDRRAAASGARLARLPTAWAIASVNSEQ
jgi:SAM-dependent methyltransferase